MKNTKQSVAGREKGLCLYIVGRVTFSHHLGRYIFAFQYVNQKKGVRGGLWRRLWGLLFISARCSI
ncbi:hypothetical protein [uncultured Gammaproteobacteria bacterium]|jgi:hypothetical protein|nr:hypothetical protein [uncultured Gammaproteobacteria bacterium]